jgi:hypothetical protein
MRSILEKALIALLNEEREKADALFHDFILERSRQIHESLRQGEDFVLDESWEKELAADQMFTEADLMGEDDDMGDSDADTVEEAEGDDEAVVASDDAAEDSEEDAADDSAEDSAMDSAEDMEGEEDLEDRVDDLEAELFRLAAEFDQLVAGEDETVDAVRGDLEGEEFGEVGGEDETLDPSMSDGFGDEDEVAEEGFDSLGEGKSFKRNNDDDADDKKQQDKDRRKAREEKKKGSEDLGESTTSELPKVSVKMADGVEQGGKSFTQNKKSPGLQPKLGDRALKGEPVKTINKTHSGFEKETAPKVDDQKYVKARNTKAKAQDGREKVSKEGDKSAELNDPMLSGANDKSLIGSTKTPMGKNL